MKGGVQEIWSREASIGGVALGVEGGEREVGEGMLG